MAYLDEDGLSTLWTKIKNLVTSSNNGILSKVYPVGSIYISVNNVNPSTLFGGTWVAWGSGKVPVGVNANDTSFSTVEKTGGSKTVDLSHSHTVNSHSHTMSHTHKVKSHNHTMAHTHTTGNFTLTENELPTRYLKNGQNGDYANYSTGGSFGGWGIAPASAMNQGAGRLYVNGGGKAHNHGSTGASSAANTGNASPGTDVSSATSTGAASPATNSKLSSTQSILQPYITCYMWKRTA